MSEQSALSSQTEAVIRQYIKVTGEGDIDGVVDLYDDQGVFLPAPPETAIVRGKSAIREHYDAIISMIHKPQYQSVDVVVSGLQGSAELHCYFPELDEHRYIVDLFTTTSEGKIARMAAYRRETR